MVNEIIDEKELRRRVKFMFGMWVFSACLIIVMAGLGIHLDVAREFGENTAKLFTLTIVCGMFLHLASAVSMSILLFDHALEWLKKTWLEMNEKKD